MLPSTLPQKKWMLLSVAMLPLALIGIGAKEQTAQAARQSNTTPQSRALPNGVYLYGNSPHPNQLLHNYVVFEQQNGQVVGAFYSPQSEFTCFTGTVQGTQLEGATLALEQPPYPVNAQLSQLHPLPTMGQNDQRILSSCKHATLSLAQGDPSVDVD